MSSHEIEMTCDNIENDEDEDFESNIESAIESAFFYFDATSPMSNPHDAIGHKGQFC